MMTRSDHPPRTERNETFRVEGEALIRLVTPAKRSGRGRKPYEHACTKDVYMDVAWAIEQMGARSFIGEDIRAQVDAPFTQVYVALVFLKERGCIEPVRGRRHVAACDYVYEDALIEYHALRETPGTVPSPQAESNPSSSSDSEVSP